MTVLHKVIKEKEKSLTECYGRIATAIGSTPSRVSRFVLGTQNPPLELAIKITEWVNINYDNGNSYSVAELFEEAK